WQQLAAEAEGLLREVLGSLAFLTNDDLVRVLDFNNWDYDFELHRGLTITHGRQPIPDCSDLNYGWFYLRRDTAELLPLHPFLIPWEEESLSQPPAQLLPMDTGVYDSFFYDRLQYLLANFGRRVPNDTNVKDFFKIVFDTIEEVKT
ncbi:MAG: hypothetical protein NT167_01810, partial [Verrucomicrobia bacterium]|nr:hypothetical protein [Verrucomicrobiota bacterium]